MGNFRRWRHHDSEIRFFLSSFVSFDGAVLLWQLAVISLLAGVCDQEVFFRSVFQGGLATHIGAIPALVASVIFGFFHLVTKTYAVIATLIGAYLGVLWLAAGNLLAPITTHAVYDFVALVYF